MPLISVAKIITLVAYVEAVAAGELNSLETVPLTDLERFYLPNFDLGAHRRAIAELREEVEAVRPLVVETMCDAFELDAPLRVEAEIGANWLELKS